MPLLTLNDFKSLAKSYGYKSCHLSQVNPGRSLVTMHINSLKPLSEELIVSVHEEKPFYLAIKLVRRLPIIHVEVETRLIY